LVKNTKAKIRRTFKNYGIDLSTQIEIPSIESFSSRKQFNEWKQKQSSFTNRANTHFQFEKNEHGVVASKHLLFEITTNTKKAQKMADERNQELAGKPFIVGGKEYGTLGQRAQLMAKPNLSIVQRPSDFDFSKIRSQRQLLERLENVRKKADPEHVNRRMEYFREKYIESLEHHFNNEADPVIEKIRKMPADDFYELYKIYDEFDILFDPSPQEGYGVQYVDESNMFGQLRQIENIVDRYYNGGEEMLLKGF
jgi:hypothetical protein